MIEYEPKPVDTSGVELPERVANLGELLAKSNHDNWALERFSQGWTLGESRDDEAKTHPCLIDYDELPEDEKTFDRRTANETLKAIIALGFKIEVA